MLLAHTIHDSYHVFPNFYCECFPHMKGKNHYNIPLALIFRQCLYSESDIASYILGWMSIIMSMISLFPQIIKNHVFQSASGLSIHLFIIWMIGDVTNLIGCIFTNQLSTQIYLAIYYVSMDVMIISQYCYYEVRWKDVIEKWKEIFYTMNHQICSGNRLKQSIHRSTSSSEQNTRSYTLLNTHALIQLFIMTTLVAWMFQSQEEEMWSSIFVRAQSHLQWNTRRANNCEQTTSDNSMYALGITCSYISCICYIMAYVPQIYKNFKKKSVKGLSLLMFLIDSLTQILYISSIIVFYAQQPHSYFDTVSVLPFIVGSVFTLIFSALILGQFFYYNNKRRNSLFKD
ncbi:hypothetical protein C9374_004922 [Naegleria lovaniensis]|uniref:Uncharacterized protein n=1 Tax=Naegleria lovaniensis TaxID=51637 RepID=A0AA88KKV8_NAELO|nr:uncharacterized protein C9374_004922 [Naegleria lovaniensis]KAG2382955.1 hypothetical protein C9374_004922 [Naegleria lovaniensis]